jgi:hypothetical protein
VELALVTPISGFQWLSENRLGSTRPSGVCLLKKPTPPMQTVWYPFMARPLTQSAASKTAVFSLVVSLPAKRAAKRRACWPGRAGVGRNPAKKAWWAA